MKKVIAGLLLLCAVSAVQAGEPIEGEKSRVVAGDSITLDYLVAMDKKKFRGKTVAEFLESPEAKGHQEVLYKVSEDGTLQAIKVKYTDTLYLNIYIDEFKYTNPAAAGNPWALDLLKKETIDEMRVVYVMYQAW